MDCALSPLVISVGEPAGIGPDICLQLASLGALSKLDRACIFIADPELLAERARWRGIDNVKIQLVDNDSVPQQPTAVGQLLVHPVSLKQACIPGILNPANSHYVTECLRIAVAGCQQGQYSALVTGPIHKATINQAGIPFTGHTEFIADQTGGHPVMMLATEGQSEVLRVALATTHLPLSQVPAAITKSTLTTVINALHNALQQRFGIKQPRIAICGLNPHAGEDGHLGHEEINTIIPCLQSLREQGMDLLGPLPADTAFTPANRQSCDAFLAMYHDQGLPVLKTVGFGKAVNITLGLPIVRTSVDHGTAIELAAQPSHSSNPDNNAIKSSSLLQALQTAQTMTRP